MKKKIKVLQFPIANTMGGTTQYVLQNWKYIDKSIFHFDFATMSKKLDIAAELEKSGSRIYYISCYAEEDEKKFIEEFRKILKSGDYDIVHLHTNQWKSFSVEKVAKEEGIKKIIIHAHNSGISFANREFRDMEEKKHYDVRNKLTKDIATDFWACSKMAADFIYGKQISREKIKIMKNAIEVNEFLYDEKIRNEYRRTLGVENRFVIGNVGRFVYQKNQEFLLQVFLEVIKEDKNCILLLIGTGEKESKYRNYVEQNGLQNNVFFMGYRNDVKNLLQAMDVFVLPSRYEGLPISAIEAQTSGLKCLCSDKITDEVKITNNLELLPLEVNIWKNKILNLKKGYKRENMAEIMTKAGYNINSQIKVLEKMYLE